MTRWETQMAVKELVQVACYLRPEQHANLKRLSDETIVPMQVYLRYAVDQLLEKHHLQARATNPEILDHRVRGMRKGAKR
jgi:predicted kinase